MLPKVTIGVCVRNGAATLPEAIESIISQDYPHELMEVIFVDDGSEDESLSIIKAYASKMDISVKIFHHEWKGLGFSRNVVVDNARGQYIIWVDCDMILPKDHVRKQVEFMEQHPKVGIGKARYEYFEEKSLVALLEKVSIIVNDTNPHALISKLPGTGGAIYRVDAIRQVGGFDVFLSGVGEDQDAAFRVKAAGWLIGRTPTYSFEREVQSWKSLWQKYFWYGYGNYKLYQKNKRILKIVRMSPLASFIYGIINSFYAYRLTNRKIFLLAFQFHFTFKMFAWFLGFLKGQISCALTKPVS